MLLVKCLVKRLISINRFRDAVITSPYYFYLPLHTNKLFPLERNHIRGKIINDRSEYRHRNLTHWSWEVCCNIKLVIFKFISKIDILITFREIALRWMLLTQWKLTNEINTGFINGLVPSGNKPLPQSVMTMSYDTRCRLYVAMIQMRNVWFHFTDMETSSRWQPDIPRSLLRL